VIRERKRGRKNIGETSYFEGPISSAEEAIDENQLCQDEESSKDVNIFSFYRINTNDICLFCGEFCCSVGLWHSCVYFLKGACQMPFSR
jgi:hypothetical protein